MAPAENVVAQHGPQGMALQTAAKRGAPSEQSCGPSSPTPTNPVLGLCVLSLTVGPCSLRAPASWSLYQDYSGFPGLAALGDHCPRWVITTDDCQQPADCDTQTGKDLFRAQVTYWHVPSPSTPSDNVSSCSSH